MELQSDSEKPLRIVTEVAALPKFYRAEDYHQGYFRNHPEQGYCQAVIPPRSPNCANTLPIFWPGAKKRRERCQGSFSGRGNKKPREFLHGVRRTEKQSA